MVLSEARLGKGSQDVSFPGPHRGDQARRSLRPVSWDGARHLASSDQDASHMGDLVCCFHFVRLPRKFTNILRLEMDKLLLAGSVCQIFL